jgi:hypothetical protein
MLPLLRVALDRGDEILVAGPHALAEMVAESGFAFWGCGEPTEAEIASIREQLATAQREVASVLGNRELFGRMAAGAMLPELTRAYVEWKPDFVLRDPCEYASAILAKMIQCQESRKSPENFPVYEHTFVACGILNT